MLASSTTWHSYRLFFFFFFFIIIITTITKPSQSPL